MAARKKTETRKGTVGVVGLGIMGGAYARLLVKAGWDVVGFDTNAARRKEAARAGVRIVADAKAVAAAAPVIITSLPSPAALESTIAGIIAAKTPRRVLIEAGTFSLADKMKAAETMQAAGHVALDCPVSGTGAQAAVGDLVVYASGDTATIKRLRPLFAGFSRGTYDLGAYGNGSRMKYVANLLVAIHNVATAEAMVLAMKAGLDAKRVLKLVSEGAGSSRVLQLRGPMMVKGNYRKATMTLATWQKDMAIIAEFAKRAGVETPLFSATAPIYRDAVKTRPQEDTAAVCAVLEKMAHYRR
jgi:3-hydroxyisobutyrate dehydrogenase-like beta-hydroxyacid dehydrogenase